MSDEGCFRFGEYTLNRGRRRLERLDQEVVLTPKAFDILVTLVDGRDRTVEKDELLERVWPGLTVEEGNLTQQISLLRKALGDDPNHPRFIATIPRRGYRWVAPLVVEESGGQPDTGEHAPAAAPLLRWLYAGAAVAAMTLTVVAGFQAWSRAISPGPASSIRSLAVLPLTTISRDPDEQFFADAMTDGVIAELSGISALKVISRTSSMQYRDTTRPLPAIAEELGADGVIVGSVLHGAGQIRIAVQLIDAVTDQSLWSRSFDAAPENVLDLQREISRAIAREIAVTLTASEEAQLTRTTPVDPEAHRLYLMGRRLMRAPWTSEGWTGDWEGVRQAFEGALDIDPTFGLAYAGLAELHLFTAVFAIVPRPVAFAQAEIAAREALDLDHSLAEAHMALGRIRLARDWDWEGAEQAFVRALELHPGSPDAHLRYPTYLRYTGRQEEAIEHRKRALDLDPRQALLSNELALELWFARRFAEAAAQYRESLELDPYNLPAHAGLAASYEQLGRYDEAVHYWVLRLRYGREPDLAEAMAAVSRTRGSEAAIRFLDEKRLETELQKPHPDPWVVAYLYARLDEHDHAFMWLDRAYDARDAGLLQIEVDPDLDSLREDPRYADLVQRVGFPY